MSAKTIIPDVTLNSLETDAQDGTIGHFSISRFQDGRIGSLEVSLPISSAMHDEAVRAIQSKSFRFFKITIELEEAST